MLIWEDCHRLFLVSLRCLLCTLTRFLLICSCNDKQHHLAFVTTLACSLTLLQQDQVDCVWTRPWGLRARNLSDQSWKIKACSQLSQLMLIAYLALNNQFNTIYAHLLLALSWSSVWYCYFNSKLRFNPQISSMRGVASSAWIIEISSRQNSIWEEIDW